MPEHVCPACQEEVDEFDQIEVDITGEWVQVTFECPLCKAIIFGDHQIELMSFQRSEK